MSRNWLSPFYKWGKWGPERLCNLSKKVEPRLIPGHLAPGICSSSHPLSHWCYLALSFSATLLSFCLQSFLASGSFPMSWPFASGEQNIGASASISVLPMNVKGRFPLRLTSLISLLSKGLSSLLQHHSDSKASNHQCSVLSRLYGPTTLTSVHYWKNHSFDYVDLCQ